MNLTVKPFGKGFAIYAGKSRLSHKMASQEIADNELRENHSLYEYWAGSAGVSIENTPAVVKHL